MFNCIIQLVNSQVLALRQALSRHNNKNIFKGTAKKTKTNSVWIVLNNAIRSSLIFYHWYLIPYSVSVSASVFVSVSWFRSSCISAAASPAVCALPMVPCGPSPIARLTLRKAKRLRRRLDWKHSKLVLKYFAWIAQPHKMKFLLYKKIHPVRTQCRKITNELHNRNSSSRLKKERRFFQVCPQLQILSNLQKRNICRVSEN